MAALIVFLLLQQPAPLDTKGLKAKSAQCELQLRNGATEAAKRAFQELLKQVPSGIEHEKDWEVYCNWRIANCDARLNEYGDAEQRLKTILDQFPAHGLAVFLHRDLGEYQLAQWKLPESIVNLDKATAMASTTGSYQLFGSAKKIDPIEVERIRVLLGSAAVRNDENEKGMVVLNEARNGLSKIREAVRSGDLPIEFWLIDADVKNATAELLRRNDETAESIAIQKQLVDDIRQLWSPEKKRALTNLTWKQISVSMFLANAYSKVHRFKDARDILDDAEKHLVRLDHDPRAGLLRGNLLDMRAQITIAEVRRQLEGTTAHVQLQLMINDAVKSATAALDNYSKFKSESVPAVANAQSTLALIEEVRGRQFETSSLSADARQAFEKSLRHTEIAISLFVGLLRKDHDAILQLRGRRAWLLWKLDRVSEARDEATETLELLKLHHGEKLVLAPLYETLLEIESVSGNVEQAKLFAQAHRHLMAESLLQYATRLTAAELSSFFRDYDDDGFHASLRLGINNPTVKRSSMEWLINGKAKGVEVFGLVSRRERGNAAYRELVANQAFQIYGTAIASSDEQLKLEKKKRDLAQGRARKDVDSWCKVESITLEPDEVYIDVFGIKDSVTGKRRYYAWVVADPETVTIVKLGDASKIDEFVAMFVDRMNRFRTQNSIESEAGDASGEDHLKKTCLKPISELIFDPIRSVAGARTKWIISPDGPLWNLPWSALIMSDGEYAARSFTFRYVVSGRDLLQRNPAPKNSGGSLIIADPDYDAKIGGSNGEIRTEDTKSFSRVESFSESRLQGEGVSKLLNRSELLTGAQATKSAIFSLKQPPHVLYVATHGFFLDPQQLSVEDPFLCSAIALAGYNVSPSVGNKNSELPGLLTAAEVLSAPLNGTELVVLSACQTSSGQTTYGNSSSSMRHAFHLAGARCVVASLWPVRASETNEQMLEFMQRFAAGTEKADSLHRSQLKLMRRLEDVEGHTHPALWAGFTISGF